MMRNNGGSFIYIYKGLFTEFSFCYHLSITYNGDSRSCAIQAILLYVQQIRISCLDINALIRHSHRGNFKLGLADSPATGIDDHHYYWFPEEIDGPGNFLMALS